MRLIEIQLGGGGDLFNPYDARIGGQKHPGAELPRLVSAYPDALKLAEEANDRFQLAEVLIVSSLIAEAGSIGFLIAGIATQPTYTYQSNTTSLVLGSVGIGLLVVGVVLTITGGSAERDGVTKWLEAVNTYNREMVDRATVPVPSS
jgi:hypothetical protein